MSSSGVNLPALDASGPRTCNPYAPPRRRLFLSEKACDEGAGQASGGTGCRTNRYGPASIFTGAKPDCADHDQPQQCCPAGPDTCLATRRVAIRHHFSSTLAGVCRDCGADQAFDGWLAESLRVGLCPAKEHVTQGCA